MPVTGCKKTGSTLFAASPNEFSLFLQPACHFLTRSTTPHRRIVVRRWHFNALHNHLYPSQTAAEEAFDVALCMVQRRLQGMSSRKLANDNHRALIRNYLKRLDDDGEGSVKFSKLRSVGKLPP